MNTFADPIVDTLTPLPKLEPQPPTAAAEASAASAGTARRRRAGKDVLTV